MNAADWVYENTNHRESVRAVLVTLAVAYTASGACLSMSDLLKRAAFSESTIRRALKTLESDGTIAIARSEGEERQHGTTNCYRIPGYDTCHEVEPLSPDDTPVTPLPFDDTPSMTPLPSVPVEYVRAAGETELLKESVKEQKEIVVNQQTDSFNPEDTRAHTVVPVQSEDETRQDFEAAAPEVQAFALEALARGNMPVAGQKAPNPPVPVNPLPPGIAGAYFAFKGMPPDEKERVVLDEIIKARGADAVVAQLNACPKMDGKGDIVRNPAAYIRTFESEPPPVSNSQASPHQDYERTFRTFSGFSTAPTGGK